MSEKLLYSLSDDKQDLHKQIGCMNGFLHLFDRNHFLNRRLLPGENSHQGRDAYGSSKISKAKHQKKVEKGLQKNDVESSRASFSSSTGSTALSSLEYEETTKSEQSLFGESNITETFSQNGRANQQQSSPYRSNSSPNMDHQFHKSHVRDMINACASSPIRTTKGEQVVRYIKSHVNSPRLLESSKFESPRLAALNESFRSISSNQSAPVTPLKQKDSPRLSYDGTETRATFISSLKFGDLPRLSLDSRQRTINKTSSELKRDSLLRDLQTEKYNTSRIENLLEEPGSYRPPSNVVAKLMGLEALPDCTLTKKGQTEPDGSICGRLDSLSASSRTIDESKVNRVLDSPRYNSKDSRTSRLNKAELPTKPKSPARSSIEKVPKKQQDEHPDSERRASKHDVECQNHCLTLYGEIEKRLADLDFKKSGKDLRALKQILDAIHREKTMKKIERENQPSGFAPQTSSGDSGYISQTQGPQKASQKHQEAIYLIPHIGKGSKGPTDIKSTEVIKPAKLVRGSRKEIGPITHEVSLSRLNQVRVDQQRDSVQESVKKRTTKDQTSELQISQEPAFQTHCTIPRDSGARTRPIQTSKVPQHMTNVKFTTSQKISDKVSIKTNNVCENHFHTPARTMCSGTTQNNQQAKGRRYQNRKLQQKPSILQDKADQSSSADSALLSQQGNANSLISKINSLISHADTVISSTYQLSMKIDTLQQASHKVIPERMQSEESFTEPAITIHEQPSPVLVLDAKFYGDESPSPVKKKSTAFRDVETTSAPTDAVWEEIDLNYAPYSILPSFSYDSQYQKLEKLKQSVQTIWQQKSGQDGNNYAHTLQELDPEKAYVAEILLASGFLDDHNLTGGNQHVSQSKGAINPDLFLVLEETRGNRFLVDKKSSSEANTITRTNDKSRRRLIFDLVNQTLSQKLSTGLRSHPQWFFSGLSRSRTGEKLLQEIFKDLDQLQANLNQSLIEEDDFLTTIRGKDLTDTATDWTDANSETSGLVLGIEQSIFKDLIVEFIHDESVYV